MVQLVDRAAKRYGKTPSQLIGLVEGNGQPHRYYGILLDIAIATKFGYEDDDKIRMDLFALEQYIVSVGKGLGVKYPSKMLKPPVKSLDIIRKEYMKQNMGKSDYIPTVEEVAESLNIKF